MDTIIRLQNVVKKYWGVFGMQPVLDDFEFAATKGEFIAVTGPSGAGKTTLLNLIGGLDHPDGGSITVDGTQLDTLKPNTLTRWRAAHIGFVFQSHYLLPMLTAIDNVELPLMLTRLSRTERRRRASDVLARVGLADWAGHRPSQLSGGQQQRVGIARAVIAGAPILLCDEPTAGLDRDTADSILALLRELSEDGRTIVMVSHDPLAAAAADRQVALAVAA
jgi:putative ABC transport system ATP-binding protein